MPAEPIQRLLAQLRRSAPADSLSDAALLERFVAGRDEAAFAALVRRHTPMVLGVCRRILRNEADAEDACQATFLVFVRKAGSIRPRAMVGGWLHGVARNTARRARLMAARRRRHEADAAAIARHTGVDSELRAIIDGELDRLPGRYKAPVVLCDLEGLTREEAARQLGWPAGTVASRLARGRRLLAGRLARAGVAGSSAAVCVVAGSEAAAGMRPGLTEQLAMCARGPAASPAARILAQGVLRTMTLKRLTTVAAGLLVAAVIVPNARELMPAAVAQAPPTPARTRPPAPERAGDDSITIQKVPPVVVKTSPVAGTEDVDPKLSEIKVTFSKEMTDETWSWSQLSDDTFPKLVGDKPIHYEKDKRTCVLKVKLEPGKTYAIWVNSDNFKNFKDADGRPAVPYLLVFTTKKAD